MPNRFVAMLSQIMIASAAIIGVSILMQQPFAGLVKENDTGSFLGVFILMLGAHYFFMKHNRSKWVARLGGYQYWKNAYDITGVTLVLLGLIYANAEMHLGLLGFALILLFVLVVPELAVSLIFRVPNVKNKVTPWLDRSAILEEIRAQETKLLVSSSKISPHLNHLTWEWVLEDDFKTKRASIAKGLFKLDQEMLDSVAFMKALADQNSRYRGVELDNLIAFKTMLKERVTAIKRIQSANYCASLLYRWELMRKAILITMLGVIVAHLA